MSRSNSKDKKSENKRGKPERIGVRKREASSSCHDAEIRALRENEARYRLLADRMNDIIWTQDLDLRTTYVSPSVEKLLGFTPEERKVQDVSEQVTPSSLARIREVLARELELEEKGGADSDRTLTIEVEYYHKDGSTRWFENVVGGIRDDSGRLMAIHGVSRDITERKRTEDILRASEQKYHSIFTYSTDAILLTTPDGGILDANPAACEMFGRSLEEIRHVGRSGVVDVTDPRVQSALIERERKERSQAEIPMLRANGEKFPAEVTSALFTDENGLQKTSMIIRDIAERKRFEEAVRERDRRFEKLASTVPGLIYQFLREPDGTYRIPFATDVIRDFYGCAPEDVVSDFSPIIEVILPLDLEEFINSIESSARNMTAWHCEYRVKVSDRPVRWLLGRSTPERLDDGSILWHGFNMDITQSRRAETEREKAVEELRRSEMHYRMVVENANDIVWIFDLDSMAYTFVSPSVERLLGFTVKEATTKTMKDSFPPESRKDVTAAFAKLVRGECEDDRVTVEAEHFHKNGGTKWLEISARVIKDDTGAVVGFSGTSRDITDRKRVEMEREQTLRQLSRSQATLRSIIEFLPEATVVIDNEGRVLEWNKAMEDLTGVAADDILGRGDHEYAVALYDDRRPMLIDVALHPELKDQTGHSRIMSFGNVLYTEAMKPAGQSGDLYLTAAAATLHDAAGNVIGAVETIRDETERRNLERQLQQSEKMVSLGRISAGVAHEILNPVGIISLELQLLHTMHDMPEAAREELDVCAKQVERIVSITNDLRQLTRMPDEEMVPDDINDIIGQVLRMYSSQFQIEDVTTEINLGEKLPVIPVNRQKIEQVIINIVSNALAAMEGKEHKILTIKTDTVESDDAPAVRITIADNGTGIRNKDLQRIFEPFYTTREQGKGTGVGLFITHEIIQRHGGTIRAENNERGGASFFVNLPVEKRAEG
ncbi:MAG: hypothetical protein AVO39_07630 [delta proteobacterium MLS_D]|nr:MAG: hypothetical protein AVO39_07630 [delta proteobacterium MLS_D]